MPPTFPTAERAQRDAGRKETRKLVTDAFHRSGVTQQQIADVLGVGQPYARSLTAADAQCGTGRQAQLNYHHLVRLAAAVETREFARLLLVPILGVVDAHQLRVADLEQMSSRPDYADAARRTLQAVTARLWPGLLPGAVTVVSPGLESQLAAAANMNSVGKKKRKGK